MKPFRIRPYRTIGGFLLIYLERQTWWFPTIASAMDVVATHIAGSKP